MNLLRIYLVLLFCSTIFSSCLKEDTPIYPTAKETVQIPMGTNYNNQFYYDLATNTIVTSHPRGNWDLAFESSPAGYHVFLNSAKFMFLNKTDDTAFNNTYSYNIDIQQTDNSNGDPLATAIGEWGEWNGDNEYNSIGEVYLLDMGVNVAGSPLGYKKLQLNSLIDDTYSFTFSNLDGSEQHTFEVSKDNRYNYVYVSLTDGGTQVFPAPEKDTWDLRFSMFTYIFTMDPGDDIPFEDGDTIPYLVNGVLLNPTGVEASELVTTSFDSLELANVISQNFTNEIDAIGFDWKYYSLNAGGYTVDTTMIYIVKDRAGDYYKLRFIDFYNEMGEKGYPTFEVKPLQ